MPRFEGKYTPRGQDADVELGIRWTPGSKYTKIAGTRVRNVLGTGRRRRR
ncbi:hypothetical protein P3H15_11280 [Rhodococcus sp. T2V]|nr:hypothetical protein [Rhodococcus sp. T2V]MDF3305602.1 hypothetical protein [Rhodococcus sp. T2V]